MELTCGQLVRDDAGASAVLDQQIEAVELVEEADVAFHALLVQGLQDHVSGAVGRVTRAHDGSLAVVARVPTEPTLVDLAVGRAIEGQAHALQVEYGVDRLAAHDLDGVLVAQEVAALDRVVRVPLPVVFLDVRQRRAHAALRRAGV